MAIKRGSRMVSTLEKLVGDLPQLMLSMQANAERNRIYEEERRAKEQMAVNELELQNINLRLQMTKEQINQDEGKIEDLENELYETTSFVPPADSVDGTGNAITTLENIINRTITTIQGGIDQRRDLAAAYVDQGDRVGQERLQRERDVETSRFLRAKMAQERALLAAGGVDPYLVEAADMESFWASSVVPELQRREYTGEEIERYRGMWGGMLGEQTSELKKAEDLRTYYSARVKDMNFSIGRIEQSWSTLTDSDKDSAIEKTNTMIAGILSPKVAAMNTSRDYNQAIQAQIQFNTIASDDSKYNPDNPKSTWRHETEKAHDNLVNRHREIGAIITGMSVAENINDEDILDLNESIGKEYIAAVTAATDKESPSHIQLMEFIATKVDPGLKYGFQLSPDGNSLIPRGTMSTDASGNQKFIPTPRSLAPGDANKIIGLLGFSKTDMAQDVIGNIVDMYDKKTEWERKRITDSLTSFEPASSGEVEHNAFGEVTDSSTPIVADMTPSVEIAAPIDDTTPVITALEEILEESLDLLAPGINIDPSRTDAIIDVLDRYVGETAGMSPSPAIRRERRIAADPARRAGYEEKGMGLKTRSPLGDIEAYNEEVNFYENQGIKVSDFMKEELRKKYGVIEKVPISDWII